MASELLTLDVEASGLSNDSYPISIGIAGSENQSQYWLICPMEDWTYWDEFAEDKHGISRDHLIEHGRDAFLVAREINALFRGMTLIVDSTWDAIWVDRLFADLGINKSFEIKHISDVAPKAMSDLIFDEIETIEWDHNAAADAMRLRGIILKHLGELHFE